MFKNEKENTLKLILMPKSKHASYFQKYEYK